MFFAPQVRARSMNCLERAMWNSRTGCWKSIRPEAVNGSEMTGKPSFSVARATRLTSCLEMPTASVAISTQSKPMREMCFSPVTVATPAW